MSKASAALPRRSRKCGQFAKVARVMLDNHRGLEICREFLDAITGSVCIFNPSALQTFITVAKLGLPSGDSAL